MTGGADGTARICNRCSGDLRTSLVGHTGSIWAVAVTPDGTEVVTAGADRIVRIWDPRSSARRSTS